MDRRELGVVNVGGPGRVVADDALHELSPRDALYVAMGTKDVRFASRGRGESRKILSRQPARACPHRDGAHHAENARKLELGAAAESNERTINQMIHPDICRSCQLVLGVTDLKPNNMWNTMPCHTHDRRSEVYLYFGLKPSARVFHLMGEPDETRHLVVANKQAVISPGWSIHSGVGTSHYSFVWAMGATTRISPTWTWWRWTRCGEAGRPRPPP